MVIGRVPARLEAGSETCSAQAEDGEERAHDGGGCGNDDPGDDAGFAVGVAFGDGIGSAPDFQHPPDEPKEEHDTECERETLSQLAGSAARGLGEDEGAEDRMCAEGK